METWAAPPRPARCRKGARAAGAGGGCFRGARPEARAGSRPSARGPWGGPSLRRRLVTWTGRGELPEPLEETPLLALDSARGGRSSAA